MVGVIALFFVLAAVFVVLGCVDQRRLYWRLSAWRYRDPAANEPSDAANRVGRFAALLLAGVWVFAGCRAMDFADGDSWTREEMRTVVVAAAETIEADAHPSGATDSMLTEALRDASEGEGPYYRLDVSTADAREGEGDRFQVSTTDGEFPFCLAFTKKESGGFAVPGADGSTTVVPEYDLTSSVDEGTC
ncbi:MULTISPECIES: hypothetical protein [unclassified Streptomyces]|uniref:hypothetical protein n=1 Tax=unclassified Streptomyces TaxID=2593676 RepID=UPI0033BAD3FC